MRGVSIYRKKAKGVSAVNEGVSIDREKEKRVSAVNEGGLH